jgi:hypothetical protein
MGLHHHDLAWHHGTVRRIAPAFLLASGRVDANEQREATLHVTGSALADMRAILMAAGPDRPAAFVIDVVEVIERPARLLPLS